MIQANELRIGNLCQNKNGLILKVSAIEKDRIIADFEDFGYSSEDWKLDPIPLDESWLIRAGFLNVSRFKWSLRGLEISFYKISDATLTYFGEEMIKKAKCKYAHQLQNLFFALTGTELEFKEL